MFAQKFLQATFEGGSIGSLTVSNLRMLMDATIWPGAQGTLDSLVIYGMTLDHMNQLAAVGMNYNTIGDQKITVTVQASDGGQQYSTVFQGDIMPGMSYIDGTDQPNVRFVCAGIWGGANARKKMAPTTQKGAVAGEDLVGQLAKKMGYRFENNGVHVMLRNPYLWGSPISQLKQCIQAMNCQWVGERQTVAIWPNNSSRQGVFNISPETNLVGYPSFSQAVMYVVAYYDPGFVPHQKVQVKSSITAANGIWDTGATNYELDSFQPHGRWFMRITCYRKDSAVPGGEPGS